ncbi:MAG: hypothetical protein U0519_05350 [Candidatus Gracilibacteria bacterium]
MNNFQMNFFENFFKISALFSTGTNWTYDNFLVLYAKPFDRVRAKKGMSSNNGLGLG